MLAEIARALLGEPGPDGRVVATFPQVDRQLPFRLEYADASLAGQAAACPRYSWTRASPGWFHVQAHLPCDSGNRGPRGARRGGGWPGRRPAGAAAVSDGP